MQILRGEIRVSADEKESPHTPTLTLNCCEDIEIAWCAQKGRNKPVHSVSALWNASMHYTDFALSVLYLSIYIKKENIKNKLEKVTLRVTRVFVNSASNTALWSMTCVSTNCSTGAVSNGAYFLKPTLATNQYKTAP